MPKKYIFSLCNINIKKLEETYGFSYSYTEEIIPNNSTKIDQVDFDKKLPDSISFLDESKKLSSCMVSKINFEEKKYCCFWCRNPIPDDVYPIGCPIKYIPDKIIKSYQSEINKEKYTISEFVTDSRIEEIKEKNEHNYKIERRGVYESDGVFCSCNCILAFLKEPENRKNPLYRYSYILLNEIYQKLFNKDLKTLIPAGHWRLLNEYGGNQDIKTFRQNFNHIEYINKGNISFIPLCKLYEDKIKF